MKKTLFFIAMCYLFSACSSKDGIVTPTALFQCKIDGKSYSISGGGAYATIFSTEKNNVYGTEAADTKITSPRTMYISILSTYGVGTYTTDRANFIFFADTDKTAYSTNYNSGTYTLTITEKSATSMKGTFSCVAKSFTNPIKTINVTEGEFSVLFR
jgi:hypothetical protein